LNYGFRFFETHQLYQSDKPLLEAPLLKGNKKKFSLGLERDLYVTIPRGRYQELQASTQVNTGVVAPVSKGQPHGTMTIRMGEHTVAEVPLLAQEDVSEGTWLQQFVDGIRLWWTQ
jgi:D-alanyl-D-alanine carboxypeptidase (penicillin-binding protein 5/6)